MIKMSNEIKMSNVIKCSDKKNGTREKESRCGKEFREFREYSSGHRPANRTRKPSQPRRVVMKALLDTELGLQRNGGSGETQQEDGRQRKVIKCG